MQLLRLATAAKQFSLLSIIIKIQAGFSFIIIQLILQILRKFYHGKLNTTYHLNIQLPDSSVYTSVTTIPQLRKTCDSLWWTPAPNNPDTSRCVLYGLFHDPPGLGDYVRYFTSVNGQPFYPGYTSAFDDAVTDGTDYTFQIPQGFNKNDTIKTSSDDYGFFHHGDSITFKFCDIDKATYDFWRTWEFAYQSNGNPFSSTGKSYWQHKQ